MASITKRNNRYCVIYNYTNPDGQRKQKWETYRTKTEALKRKKEIEYKESRGALVVTQCKSLKDLLDEYVRLHGKEKWALSTYEGNVSLIKNYIVPIIGKAKLTEINTRFIEIYYQQLLKTPAVPGIISSKKKTSVSLWVRSATSTSFSAAASMRQRNGR